MADLQNRRRFLQLTGTGVAASLAGCSTLGIGQDDSGDDDDGGIDADDIPDSAVTAALEPDPEATEELEELRADLTQRIEDGELSEEEADAEFREQQTELLEDAVTAFESYADEHDITVHSSIPEVGAVLIEGDGDALTTALNEGEISSLLPSETFVRVQQQQMLQEEMGQPAEEGGDDEIEGGEDEADEADEEDDESEDDADDDAEEADDGSDDETVDEDSDDGGDADDDEESSDDGTADEDDEEGSDEGDDDSDT